MSEHTHDRIKGHLLPNSPCSVCVGGGVQVPAALSQALDMGFKGSFRVREWNWMALCGLSLQG